MHARPLSFVQLPFERRLQFPSHGCPGSIKVPPRDVNSTTIVTNCTARVIAPLTLSYGFKYYSYSLSMRRGYRTFLNWLYSRPTARGLRLASAGGAPCNLEVTTNPM